MFENATVYSLTAESADINLKFSVALDAAVAVLGGEHTRESILSPTRLRRIVDARKLIMMYMLENTNVTTTRLGKLMKRDHATVIHNYRQARSLVASKDKEFINMYYVFKELIDQEFTEKKININYIGILCGRLEMLSDIVKRGQRIRYVAPNK